MKKFTSQAWAKPKIIQLELWLEPVWLGLMITNDPCNNWLNSIRESQGIKAILSTLSGMVLTERLFNLVFFLTLQQMNYWVPDPTWHWIGVNPTPECPWVSAVNNTEVPSRTKLHKVMTKNGWQSLWIIQLGLAEAQEWVTKNELKSFWVKVCVF